MQFIFGYEMGDLIFCELDITSSLSTTKRMCVKNKSLSWSYITEKHSSVGSVEQNTLNPGRVFAVLQLQQIPLKLQKQAQSGQQVLFRLYTSGIPAFVVSGVSCCSQNYAGGNDSTGDQSYGHRLMYFGKELRLAAVIL